MSSRLVFKRNPSPVMAVVLALNFGLSAFRAHEPVRSLWRALGGYPLAVIVGCFAAVAFIMFTRAFSEKAAVIDDDGVAFARRPGFVLPWSRIEACAASDRFLRLWLQANPYLRPAPDHPRAATTPNQSLGARAYIDIDFRFVAQRAHALDSARDACVERLAAQGGGAPAAYLRAFDPRLPPQSLGVARAQILDLVGAGVLIFVIFSGAYFVSVSR